VTPRGGVAECSSSPTKVPPAGRVPVLYLKRLAESVRRRPADGVGGTRVCPQRGHARAQDRIPPAIAERRQSLTRRDLTECHGCVTYKPSILPSRRTSASSNSSGDHRIVTPLACISSRVVWSITPFLPAKPSARLPAQSTTRSTDWSTCRPGPRPCRSASRPQQLPLRLLRQLILRIPPQPP
jgi:hypothetical protein